MVTNPVGVSGRKIILMLAVAILLFGSLLIDRLIYFRDTSWLAAAMKGFGAIYFGCEKPIEIREAVTGDWLVQYCDPKSPVEFVRQAREIVVFPGGCSQEPVVAWGRETHYWAEEWMPFAPKAGRYVLFDNRTTGFVPLDEFASFGCPR